MHPPGSLCGGLCYHYDVELHNFSPNDISQAATFVGVYEGCLGVPLSWDLWLHLFRASCSRRRPAGRVGTDPFTLAGSHSRCRGRGQRIPALHHDEQQCEVGPGVLLPPQRRR
jgi:hypothetical protein